MALLLRPALDATVATVATISTVQTLLTSAAHNRVFQIIGAKQH
jgi:hypothetical protein